MRLPWILFVVVTALVVFFGVSTLLSLAPDAEPLPELHLTAADGSEASLWDLRGRIWIAAFVTAEPPTADAALEELRAALPERIALVTLAGGDGSFATPAPAEPGQHRLFGPHELLVELAVDHFGFSPHEAGASGGASGPLLLATVDRAERVRGRYRIEAGTAEPWSEIVTDAAFLAGMDSRPLLHAVLNASSAVLLSLGFLFVRRKKIGAHLACMVLAALVTLGFLGSYLYYHYHSGSMPFRGTGWIRPVYFSILLTHTVLAAFVAPLAASLFWFAARRRFERHRSIARWALPLWLYVSVTGVLIYFLLYVWFSGV